LEKRANQTKTRFLANVSHDLRTPLGAILGYAEILAHGPNLDPIVKDYLERIRRNSQMVLELVDDLLDLSKVEAGRLEIKPRKVDLLRELEVMFNAYAVKAGAKGIDFTFDFRSPLRRWILTDSLRMRQVIDNLVTNAIKYTESGTVSVVVDAEERA